jgi:excisionase family DNA binding protein
VSDLWQQFGPPTPVPLTVRARPERRPREEAKERSIDANTRLAFRPSEAARVLGVGEDFFREYVQSELRWVRRGRVKLVARAELERWLERQAEHVLREEGSR